MVTSKLLQLMKRNTMERKLNSLHSHATLDLTSYELV